MSEKTWIDINIDIDRDWDREMVRRKEERGKEGGREERKEKREGRRKENENLCGHDHIKNGARSPATLAVIYPITMTPLLTKMNHSADF